MTVLEIGGLASSAVAWFLVGYWYTQAKEWKRRYKQEAQHARHMTERRDCWREKTFELLAEAAAKPFDNPETIPNRERRDFGGSVSAARTGPETPRVAGNAQPAPKVAEKPTTGRETASLESGGGR